jgi:UDP-N-acetylmuramate--alanine ligase
MVVRALHEEPAVGSGPVGSRFRLPEFATDATRALAAFRVTRRRGEVVGEACDILVIDDYGHHPTAITSTIAGLREFYPGRRIVLDFMSHTYSRTHALLDGFARAVCTADVVVLHEIYASAREHYTGEVTGETLFRAARARCDNVHYVPGVLDALPLVEELIRPGDLFVTMGAGNNWELGRALYERLSSREAVR